LSLLNSAFSTTVGRDDIQAKIKRKDTGCFDMREIKVNINSTCSVKQKYFGNLKVVGLERGPLSLVSTTEELLDRKVAAPV
jgi:hypothetical protein